MNNKDFEICGLNVKPGKRMRQDIPVAQLFDRTQMTIPIEIVRGREEGPVLLLTAAMHGDEINGCEIVKRVLTHRNLINKLRGTLVAVPIVNVFGFNNNVRYLPDRRDLNRCFPGGNAGSLGAQVARVLLKDIAYKCTHVIDFHTGAIHRSNYPQVRTTLDSEASLELAKSFNMPVILNSAIRDGSFRKELTKKGIPNIVFEGGEALRYESSVIKAGLNGTFSAMVSLGMIQPSDVKIHRLKQTPYIAHTSVWMRAPSAGSLRLIKGLGSHIKEGDLIGVISDPYGRNKKYLRAIHDGVIVGIRNLPLVMDGDAIVHVAMFENLKKVMKEIELLDEEVDVYTL